MSQENQLADSNNNDTKKRVSFNTNKLFYGDNLEILRSTRIPSESVDLIYLDPPFNSKADYNILFKEPTGEHSTAQIQAFSDFWHWDSAAREAYEYLTGNEVDKKISDLAVALMHLLGKNDMSAYLFMMTLRLIELHRVLKKTGSLFLHCDPTASHYLKLVLDTIFGGNNFRNEIIWKRSTGHPLSIKKFEAITDSILMYVKSELCNFYPVTQPLTQEAIDRDYANKDEHGYYMLDNLTAGKVGGKESYLPFKGTLPPKGRAWAPPRREKLPKWAGEKLPSNYEQLNQLEKCVALDRIGLIYWTKTHTPRFKRYLPDNPTRFATSLWDDIHPISSQSNERLGYPTQKPIALVGRILQACSKEGDWVLDPFCGCGTAISASEKFGRHWIGIDITWLAINLVKNRLKAEFPGSKFELEGDPKDFGAAKELAKNRYQFQWWALSLIGARPVGAKSDNPREGKKGADEGIDGWLRFRDGEKVESIVVQVKSGHVSVKDIRELRDVVARQKAAMGIFITLSDTTREMDKEIKATDPYVMKAMHIKFPKIQILTIEQLLHGISPELPATASAFEQAPLAKHVSSKANYRLDDHQMQSR